MWVGVALFALLAVVAGALLAYAASTVPASTGSLVDKVDELLPQTQCAQCGYPGCRPYARAVVEDGAAINLCPPGGERTVARLAELLGREALPLAAPNAETRQVAIIDESRCIGCLHCRNACPVDAIVGAEKLMHSVIASECTGCELCIAPCPVDCIDLRSVA